MGFAFDAIRKLALSTFIVRAIVTVIVADALLLGFILLRRTYRKRHFATRDARMFAIRQQWDALVSGEISYESWRTNRFDRRLIESMVLDAFEIAKPEEAARLLKFMRYSGLIEKRIADARGHKGWRRNRALVALGRTRAPEGIRALAEGLRDRNPETRLAALRGLGQMACPDAARQILSWVDEAGLTVPALPLQSALVQTCAERPQLLLPHLQHAAPIVREVLARVLGEVATSALGPELLQYSGDPLPELRAAAARGLAYLRPAAAVSVLGELASDQVWFVRLRAIVSLGRLCHASCLPLLLHGLRDSNRLVRLRAAEGLADFKEDRVRIFEMVVDLRDQYGLHAYLTAIENADLQSTLNAEITANPHLSGDDRALLLEILRTGSLSAGPSALPANSRAMAASAS